MPLSDWDFRKVINAKKEEQYSEFMCYWMESFLVFIREYNEKKKPGEPPITQFTVIADANRYPYGQILSLAGI